MSDYLQQVKEIFDSLIVAEVFVSYCDRIATALAGLLDEFESFIDSIMLHLSSTYLHELHGFFIFIFYIKGVINDSMEENCHI